MKNILNLEINKFVIDAAEGISILLKVFNSFSSRFFSFLNPALLDSPGRIAEMF
jgi:hypothetical protein